MEDSSLSTVDRNKSSLPKEEEQLSDPDRGSQS